jgi:DNA-directed RNA polymerase subunit RPC12/RpoP
MAKFTFAVRETCVWERIYLVEAPSQSEAAEKAGRGETFHEDDIKFVKVLSREITAGGPLLYCPRCDSLDVTDCADAASNCDRGEGAPLSYHCANCGHTWEKK